jgi:hypothetical protein
MLSPSSPAEGRVEVELNLADWEDASYTRERLELAALLPLLPLC